MVAVTAILVGYLGGQLFPSVLNSAVPSPLLMILFCIVFPFFVGYIAYSGVNASTGVNLAINVLHGVVNDLMLEFSQSFVRFQ